mgnify:CR=1 FL=1
MARNRKLNRLKDYDYSQAGYYYVTVCTKDRQEWLGEIKDGAMIFNECGGIVGRYWAQIPQHYGNVTLDEFVVMPNHVHGIIIIDGIVVGTEQCSVPTIKPVSLSQIIKSLKDVTTKQIRSQCGIHFSWQRSFHDHIIRDEYDLCRIREYIINNPLKWDDDVEN